MSSLNIVNRKPYPVRTGPGMPERDWAHNQNLGTDRVNRDLDAGIQPPQAVKDVLARAGWNGGKLTMDDAKLLHDSADSFSADGKVHSFAFNITQGYPEYDTDPNTNPADGGSPTTPPAPLPADHAQQVKDAEAFGRANVRQDIKARIDIMRRKKREDSVIVEEVLFYCVSGSWPQSGSPAGGSGGFHVPGSSS